MERVTGVLLSLSMAAFAGAAEAKPRNAEAVLASAPGGAVREVIDGRVWQCLGTGCRGTSASAPKAQPVVFECQGVAARFGAVAEYRSGGKALGAEQLAECNAVARAPSPTAVAQAR